MSSNKFDQLRRARKEFNIKIIENRPKLEEWPDSLKADIAIVQKLGNRSSTHMNDDAEWKKQHPWQNTLLTRAELLTKGPEGEDRLNEATVRRAYEHIIFSRLDAETSCSECGGRYWRSDLEVQYRESDTSHVAQSVRERQARRRLCQCSDHEGYCDIHELVGDNKIFTHREEAYVYFDNEVCTKTGPSYQKPDSIYGLKRTANIESLLDKLGRRQYHGNADKNGIKIDDDALVFPFMICESKKSDTPNDFRGISIQTALPIKASLDCQYWLARDAAITNPNVFQPMVWFFSHKGKEWRLSLSYCRPRTVSITNGSTNHQVTNSGGTDNNDTLDYYIVDVWRNSIATYDGAIQLLLLVGYVTDWARDKYRYHILSLLTAVQTKSFTPNELLNLPALDPDIFSTIAPEDNVQAIRPMNGLSTHEKRDLFRRFDTELFAVRSALFTETQCRFLILTKDNIDEFFTTHQRLHSSTKSDLCKRLAELLVTAGTMTWEDITQLEQNLTGYERMQPTEPNYFRVCISFTTYLSAAWDIVTALDVLVVDADLLYRIQRQANENAHVAIDYIFHFIPIKKTAVDELLQKIKRRSVVYVLLSAIQRQSYMIHWHESESWSKYYETEGENALRNLVNKLDQMLKQHATVTHSVFISTLTAYDMRQRDKDDSRNIATYSDNTQGFTKRGYALLYCFKTEGTQFCLFSTRKNINHEINVLDSKAEAREVFETRDIFHTRRQIEQDTLKNQIWNLQSVYGIYSQGFQLAGLYDGMYPFEVVQGASRKTHFCGNYNLTRQLFPGASWNKEAKYNIFMIYKIILSDFAFWSTRAAERRVVGIPCCKICAYRLNAGDICNKCQTALASSNQISWVKYAMKHSLVARVPFDINQGIVRRALRVLASRESKPDSLSRHDMWTALFQVYKEISKTCSDLSNLEKQYVEFSNWKQQQNRERKTALRFGPGSSQNDPMPIVD